MYDIAEIYAQNLHAEPHFFTTKVGIINLDTYRRDSENESGYLTYPTLSYQNLNKKLYNQASLINIFIFFKWDYSARIYVRNIHFYYKKNDLLDLFTVNFQ